MTELPDWARRGRAKWTHTGASRPPFAEEPGPGQESVWDYPRPPALAPDPRPVRVVCGETVLAETRRAVRILETASPPTFYLPAADVGGALLEPAPDTSRCEWKGEARHLDLVLPDRRLPGVAWTYPAPFPEYREIAGFLAFYPARLECTVGGVPVAPQPGGIYGGWVTPDLAGPWKGDPGTEDW